MRLATTALACLVAASVVAAAGEGPEIEDGREVAEVHAGVGVVNVVAREIDLLAVSVDVAGPHATFTFEVDDLGHRTPGFEGASYVLTYRDAEHTSASLQATRHGENWTYLWYAFDADGAEVLVPNGTVSGNEIVVELPTARLHTRLTHLKASAILLVSTGSGGSWGGGNVWFRDWAPNEGYGRERDVGS